MAPNCESFETWGFTDKVSWLKEPKNALPFDKNFKKKSTYHDMRYLLKSFDRNEPAVVERNKRIAEEGHKKLGMPVMTDEQFEVDDTAKNMFVY